MKIFLRFVLNDKKKITAKNNGTKILDRIQSILVGMELYLKKYI